MVDPLSSYPTSVRLKTSSFPAAQLIDAGGTLESALLVSGLVDYPASTSGAFDVTSGSPTMIGTVGQDVSSVAPGSTASGTGFADIPISAVIAGSSKVRSRTSVVSTDPKAVIYLDPGEVTTDIVVGQKLVCSSFASGTTVVATPAEPLIIGMAITTTSASATVTVASTATLKVGMYVTAPTIPEGRFISAIASGTTFTLNSATSVTAGTATAAVIQFRLAEKSTRDASSTLSNTTVFCSTAGLVAGQMFTHPGFPTGTYVSSISNGESFIASTSATSSLSGDAEFGPIIAVSTASTVTATGLTVTFGPVIRASSNATSSATGTTITFTGNGKTIEDIRDGDYCVVSIPMLQNTGVITVYLMAFGYLRYTNIGRGQFALYTQRTGGVAVTDLVNPTGGVITFSTHTAGPYVVAITQVSDIIFPYRGFKLKGKMASAPDLIKGEEPIRLKRSYLTARMNADCFLSPVGGNEYVTLRQGRLVARMASAPDIDSIESDITLVDTTLKGRMSTAPALIGGYLRVTASVRGALYSGPVQILRNGEQINLSPGLLTARTSAFLSGSEYFRRNEPIRGLVRSNGLRFMIQGAGLSVTDAINSLMQLWYQLTPSTSPADVQAKAIEVLSTSLQLIFSRARHLDYFNKGPITVTVPADSSSVAIPKNVQTVLGNVRLDEDDTPLWSCASRQEITNAPSLFGLEATGSPQFYFIENEKTIEADSVQSTLYVSPRPTEDTDITLDAASEAPRYTWRDYELHTPLQLPHAYAEMLLFPIMRYSGTSYRLFLSPDQMPQIKEQYAKAMRQLGIVDPSPKQSARPQTAEVSGVE